MLLVNTFTSLAQLAFAWGLWRRVFRPTVPANPSPPFDYAKVRLLLARAWPFALAAVFAALQMRLSLIVLDRLASVAEVADFAAASRFVEATRLVPNAFFGALFPALAALAVQPHALERTFSHSLRLLTLFGVAAITGSLLLASPLVRLTYGEEFAAAVPVLQVLMLALLFSLLRGAYTLALYARDAESRVNRINAAALALQLPLSLWLVRQSGADGAALALLVTEAFALVWLWAEQRGHTRVPAGERA